MARLDFAILAFAALVLVGAGAIMIPSAGVQICSSADTYDNFFRIFENVSYSTQFLLDQPPGFGQH
jgi:hypothetical protein